MKKPAEQSTTRYEFIVIGSGPAGTSAAIQASKLGKRVLLIEKTQIVGGVTVHTGTIPSKILRETNLFLSNWQQRGIYSRNYKIKDRITAEDLTQRLQATLNKEVEIIQQQLKRHNIAIAYGHARFVGDGQKVSVEDHHGHVTEYEGEKFLICVGSKTRRPENVPFDGESVIDTDEIINMNRIPNKLLVVGAGVIGLEYATIFRALDIEVTILESKNHILEFAEKDIVDEMMHHLHDSNIKLRLNEELETIRKRDDGMVICHLQSGQSICVDTVLFAVGRQGVAGDLALEKLGIEVDSQGQIQVNDNHQTSQPHIYGAGDVIGYPGLTSTSMEQGRLAACHAFGKEVNCQPDLFPYGIYALPEISMVGLTEKQCDQRGISFVVGVAKFKDTARGQIMGLREGMLKLIFCRETQKLLGVHIVGEGATEMVHIGQAVIALGGTVDYFLQTVFNYPTLAEVYKAAALYAHKRI